MLKGKARSAGLGERAVRIRPLTDASRILTARSPSPAERAFPLSIAGPCHRFPSAALEFGLRTARATSTGRRWSRSHGAPGTGGFGTVVRMDRRSLAPLLEETPGLLDEVVESGVVAVHYLPRARHGGCDILDREQRRALPLGGLGFVFGHGAQRLRSGPDASATCEPGPKAPKGQVCGGTAVARGGVGRRSRERSGANRSPAAAGAHGGDSAIGAGESAAFVDPAVGVDARRCGRVRDVAVRDRQHRGDEAKRPRRLLLGGPRRAAAPARVLLA